MDTILIAKIQGSEWLVVLISQESFKLRTKEFMTCLSMIH